MISRQIQFNPDESVPRKSHYRKWLSGKMEIFFPEKVQRSATRSRGCDHRSPADTKGQQKNRRRRRRRRRRKRGTRGKCSTGREERGERREEREREKRNKQRMKRGTKQQVVKDGRRREMDKMATGSSPLPAATFQSATRSDSSSLVNTFPIDHFQIKLFQFYLFPSVFRHFLPGSSFFH